MKAMVEFEDRVPKYLVFHQKGPFNERKRGYTHAPFLSQQNSENL
jgi:hypothetical protein